MPDLRLGTRASPLALRQTELVVEALRRFAPELSVEVVPMTTLGDRDLRPLRELGDRGVFAKDLEQALLNGGLDAVVHSCKDLALIDTPGLQITALLVRDEPRDALCATSGARSLGDLPQGATIGTSSVRRRAALAHLRPDLHCVDIRGNVQTRLRHAREEQLDGVVLAAAGLQRLGLDHEIAALFSVADLVPEAGQGAIAIQTRAGEALPELTLLNDPTTAWAVDIERQVAHGLGGGCDTPVGVHVDLSSPIPVAQVFIGLPEAAVQFDRELDRQLDPDQLVRGLLEQAHRHGAPHIVEDAQR